ncbi:purine and uridine phosphorylase [Parathielavia appendiculata]|uniref:Purine and uridine phosphorylase n=1 Tax=Parathielavia appendiculata TaxID=2587402 RepID=A0AAN6TRI2_9PEZI|nr:purine and uridine phosphorylase [Parathielavia appendiculata]
MNTARPRRPAARADFEIAVICALPIEADAVDALFDHHWDDDGAPYDKAGGDPNAYSTGAIGRHNVVLAHMPGMGKASAAAVAANCRASFPNIKLALVVGVCGVVPFRPGGSGGTAETVLGDVIVSDGVVQYDLGRRLPEQFVPKDTLLDTLGRPNTEIRALLAKLRGLRSRKMLQAKMAGYMDVLRGEPELAAAYPGAAQDKLFEATYRHVRDGMSCEECGCDGKLVPRARLEQGDGQPAVHFGLIASGDTVMKSGKDRDDIAREAGVVGFEMESAGVWDIFPCVVIKGACDYADSHKTKAWQRYAAATAAACMKAFLSYWVPSLPEHLLMPYRLATAKPATDRAALPCHYIPLPENRRFVGRKETLDTLKEMLFVRKECRKAAIVGLGGVGKTQVALQLAYWTKKHRPEFSIFWVPALSKATLEQAFTAMARNLPIQSGGDDDDLKVSVRRYLSSEAAGPWLLVVDNADDRDILFGSADMPGGISDYLPESDNGLTLFTTRSREVAVSVTGSDVIELNAMDQPEAAVFLEKSLIQKDMLRDEGATAELLKELTYLPLAISQAAAYINIKQVSLAEYVKLLHGTQQDIVSLMSKEFRDNTRYAGSQNAVATTWLVSFDQIRKSDNAAADLLSFISCIEPKGIPQSLFPDSESTAQLVDAIGTLCSYAFLTRREDSNVFDMHGLVHLATRIWVQREGLTATTGKKAIRHIATVFPSDDYANRNVWREYLPHAFRVLQQSKELDIEERSDLLFWVGQCLTVDGRIKEAARNHPSRLASQHELAGAYRANGQVKEAVALLEQVVAIKAKTLAEDHPSRLASQQWLEYILEAADQDELDYNVSGSH